GISFTRCFSAQDTCYSARGTPHFGAGRWISGGTMRISPRRSRAALLAAVSILGPASIAFGNADSWKTASSGTWGVGSNWVDGTTPGNGDTATFNVFGSYTVTFNAAPADIQAMSVQQGTAIMTSTGGAKTLNLSAAAGAQDLFVSGGSTGLFLGTNG